MANSEIKASHEKVMVIDDNDVDLYIAQLCIQQYAFAREIILKNTARKALEYLISLEETPEQLPDLIFLDIRMPEIDGFGFLEEYEKLSDSIRRKCIIVMLSSSLNKDDHKRADGNKFVNRFITKPLNKEKLQEI